MAQVGDIFLCSWVGTVFNQRFMLTHTYRLDVMAGGVISDIDAQTLLMSGWGGVGAGTHMDTYAKCLITAATINEAWVQKVKPIRIRKKQENVAVVGTAGPNYTANVAAAVEFQTDFATRKGIAVKKVGPAPMTSTLALAGKWDAAYIVLLGNLGIALSTPYTFAGGNQVFTPCVWHRSAGFPPYGDPITAYKVQDTCRVNRRRTLGLGI